MLLKTRAALVCVALTFAGVSLGACSSAGSTAPADLEGSWVLESFGGTNELIAADPAVNTEITMKAGKATGSGGVNSFSTSYEAADDGSISFGPVVSTKMAGPPEAMEQEAEFFAALDAAESFELNDGKVVFGDLGNNTLMVLVTK